MTTHQELTACIVALFLETLLFGAFAVTYTMGTWSLLTTLASRRRSTRDWVLLGASTAMFGLALAHLALSLKLTIFGFVTNAGSFDSVGNALRGSSWPWAPAGGPRFGIYVTQTLIGDVFMIYRLFLVWNRSRKVIIFPVALCFIYAVSGYVALVPGLPVGLTIFLSLSFTSNMFCSSLILWRVFHMNQHTPLSATPKLFGKVIEAIVQSAAIYAIASTALMVVTISTKSDFVLPAVFDASTPLIGLVFSFIVLRMARSSADDAARVAIHTQDRRVDDRRDAISIPMSVRPPRASFLQPKYRLPTIDPAEDLQATDGSTTSTGSVKPAQPLLPHDSELADVHHLNLESQSGVDLGVLDIRAEKLAWNV